MTQQIKSYRERSREYLAKAFEELDAGDLTQAGVSANPHIVMPLDGIRCLISRPGVSQFSRW